MRGEIEEKELKIDEEKYALSGRLRKGRAGDETIQLEFKLVDEEEDEDENEGWKQQEFTVPPKGE